MKHKLFLRRFFASLLLCAVSTLSFAGFVVDGITYINEDEKSVSVDIGYLPYSGSVTIPSSVTYEDKTYSVTSIGADAFWGCSSLTSITIPESVTSIGYRAFSGCSGLTSVTIPNSVTSIGNKAFSGCSGLTSVTIPNSVTSIGYEAFDGCSGLTSVTIGSGVTSIGDGAFENCTGLTKAEFVSIESLCKISFTFFLGHSSNPLYYAKHLYLNGEEVKDLIIPNSVTSIGNYAFYGCSGLTSVTIPESVTSIGNYAFSGCSGLTSVNIGNGVTSIGGLAFRDCSGLTSITIPENVTSIGNKAFSGCSGLMSVTINSNAVLSKSYPPMSVDDGGMLNRFGGQVTEFIIGNNVTSIGNNAFMACSGLTSITIPNSVTSIGFSAFASCSGLTSITIPESVTSISSRAFENCSGLTSVIIPESVTSIGADAFRLCSGLTKAEFSNIESLCRISFGDNDSNPLYYAKHLYVKGNEVKDVIIPNSVTTIGNFAFYGCSGLTSITIPESVTSISPRAFTGCSGLTSITIPESVASIGIATFYGCSGLTSVTIGNGVTSIDAEAFRGCSGLTSVTIGSIVTSIGEGAFYDCSSLKSVTCLAPNVPNTGRNLFYNVPKSTATLYVPKASVDAYKAANQWKDFGKIVPLTVPATAISINETELILNHKASFQLKATVEPNYASQVVTWASSNPTVATISKSGLVTAIAPGVATITATTTDGTNLTASCQVTVNGTDMSGKCGDDVYFEISDDGTMVISGTGEMADYASSTNIPWYDNRNNIKSVVIEDGVTSIGNRVFYLCTALTSVTIPSSVTRIGDSAFRNCSSLTTVTCFAENVPSMGSNVFYNASQNKATLYVPTSSLDAYKTADQWKLFVKKMPIDVLTVKDMKRAKALKTNSNAPIYDLMGRRLKEKPAKGYYIQGGKKYLVK